MVIQDGLATLENNWSFYEVTQTPYYSAWILLLGIHPREMKTHVHKKTRMQMIITAELKTQQL